MALLELLPVPLERLGDVLVFLEVSLRLLKKGGSEAFAHLRELLRDQCEQALEDVVLVADLVLRQLALVAEEVTVQLSKSLVEVCRFLTSFHCQAGLLTDARDGLEVVLSTPWLLFAVRLGRLAPVLGELVLKKLHLHLKFPNQLTQSAGLSLSLTDLKFMPLLRLNDGHIPCLSELLLFDLPLSASALHLASEYLKLSLGLTLLPFLLLLYPLAHGSEPLVLTQQTFDLVFPCSLGPLHSLPDAAVVSQPRLLLECHRQEPVVLGRDCLLSGEVGLGPETRCLSVVTFVKECLHVIEDRSQVSRVD